MSASTLQDVQAKLTALDDLLKGLKERRRHLVAAVKALTKFEARAGE